MTKSLTKNIFSLFAITTVLLVSSSAFAEGAMTAEAAQMSTRGWVAISAAMAIGLAVIGGALAQGKAAAAALEGIARNPASAGKIFTPMILGLALVESLVIFALLIAFQLVGKI